MESKKLLVWCGIVSWSAMNTIAFAVNCNCCCKVVDTYGYDPGGGAATSCWQFEDGTSLQGLVVDSGVCIQEDFDLGMDTSRYSFSGCDLVCVGRNPDGFTDPNPLQEATGDAPPNSPFTPFPMYDCREPPPDVTPNNNCG